MKVKWYGHAAFNLTSDEGRRLIIDPYEPGGFGGALSYGPIRDEADIVLVSHDHADHNYIQGLLGRPQVIKGKGIHYYKDWPIRGIPSFHDEGKGTQRGENTIFCFILDEIRVCHLGDLGHVPTEEQTLQIGSVDLLLIPVGGVYTIDPAQASKTLEKIKPKLAIPMHYKTPRCGFPLASVEEFIKGKRVKNYQTSELQITRKDLPENSEVVVLQPAL